MDTDESKPEKVYNWTVRGLYLAAIAANLWYFLETYRDTPEAKTLLAKASRLGRKVTRPITENKRLRRAINETLIDAEVTVKMAAKGDE